MNVSDLDRNENLVRKRVRRFPRLKKRGSSAATSENVEDKLRTERVILETAAIRLITRRAEVRMQLGRVFKRLKDMTSHGEWEPYFAETFSSLISLRTAQRLMNLVRPSENGADSKNDDMTLYGTANDPQAVQVRDATAQAEIAVRNGVRLARIFRLPLFMTADDEDRVRALLKSSHWPTAQGEVVTLLKKLHTKFNGVRKE